MNEIELKDLESTILTRRDVMRILKKSQPTIWKWVRLGILREHRIGRSVFYYKHELLEDIGKNNIPLEKKERVKAAAHG